MLQTKILVFSPKGILLNSTGRYFQYSGDEAIKFKKKGKLQVNVPKSQEIQFYGFPPGNQNIEITVVMDKIQTSFIEGIIIKPYMKMNAFEIFILEKAIDAQMISFKRANDVYDLLKQFKELIKMDF